MTEALRCAREPGLSRITLNQPDRRNALSQAMWRGLPGLIAAAAADPAVRVVVIEGAGGHFAAGADISEFETVYATRESAEAYSDAVDQALAAIADCPKPTIARIEGACVGGGCSVALACDFRFAAHGAKFGITPGKLGLVYPMADTRRLAATIGQGQAKRLLFTGALIEAEEALAIGLIDALEDKAAQAARIEALAAALAPISAWSIAATKRMLALTTAADQHALDGRELFLSAFTGADFQEGYRAFLDKRAPRFPSAG